MKANELRIGNWITIYGVPNQVKADWIGNIDKANQNGKIMLDSPEPIPLTEEWLERFGFKYEGEFDFERSNIGIEKINGHWTVWTCGTIEPFWSDIRYNIEYVHQLQNLYFALTGKELEIKEKVK